MSTLRKDRKHKSDHSTSYECSDRKLRLDLDTFFLRCVRQWYPKLPTKIYFLPPIHIKHIPYTTRNMPGAEILEVPTDLISHSQVHDCHERGEQGQEEFLRCLRAIAKTCTPKEAMVVISQLSFGKYLKKPFYAAAADLFPLPNDLPDEYHQGDFDVLIIHSRLGLIVLEIKSVGVNFQELNKTEYEENAILESVIEKAIRQLSKAHIVLRHLVSDIADVNITRTLVLPYIDSSRLEKALKNDSLQKSLCNCLKVQDLEEVMRLCLCADQISHLNTACDEYEQVIIANRTNWWNHLRNAANSENNVTFPVYEKLVARFCGPATTVQIHCVTTPRLSLELRTEGEGVSEVGERMARFVLYPDQVDLLNKPPSQRVFLVGPPGTGKTVVLTLHGLNCLQRNIAVYIVSTWIKSMAASILIESQIRNSAKSWNPEAMLNDFQVTRLQYDFMNNDEDVKNAVTALTFASERGRQICVIADEAGPDYGIKRERFSEFCEELTKSSQTLCLWGAAVHHRIAPECLTRIDMTFPLRSPPVVVREIKESPEIRKLNHVDSYTEVYAETDGPPIKRITHCRDQNGHVGNKPEDCEQCGKNLADILADLHVGMTIFKVNEDQPPPPPGHQVIYTPDLLYQDVLVLCDTLREERLDSSGKVTQKPMGFVRGLRASHVPVRVVEMGAPEDVIRDIALKRIDAVVVTHIDNVRGLERKVIVTGNGLTSHASLHGSSRCSSQLVLVECKRPGESKPP